MKVVLAFFAICLFLFLGAGIIISETESEEVKLVRQTKDLQVDLVKDMKSVDSLLIEIRNRITDYEFKGAEQLIDSTLMISLKDCDALLRMQKEFEKDSSEYHSTELVRILKDNKKNIKLTLGIE